ncbi:MAG: YdeI/OmpD-associated family protein [Acidobacteria bacterium]|nr:YdeI/OmpD-associated family protein [Acidobacteriota bacterium]
MNRMLFTNRAEFRTWLTKNALADQGVWLIFGKSARVETIRADEALEEALCFGWIDGQIRSVDNDTYVKYFKQRDVASHWSDKNKGLVRKLESLGLMTDFGRTKIEIARQNGRWTAPKPGALTDDQARSFEDMLKPHAIACANFMKMAPSARKTYAKSYFLGAKTDEGRHKRFAAIIERLELNLNPMESLKKRG